VSADNFYSSGEVEWSMTNNQLKNLKDRLWEGADQLRANSGLKSTEYATPILGLIFLLFAQSKYVSLGYC